MSDTCDYLIADAPLPPSLNRLFEPHRIGSRCSVGKSSKYKRWKRDVFTPWWLTMRAGGRLDFGEAVIVWCIVCPPRAGVDVDNYSKCFFDCLQTAGAIIDDNRIVSQRNEKGPRVRGGLLRVFIANERHRERLAGDFEAEMATRWLPLRDGPILAPARPEHHRAGFVETRRPAESPD